MARRPGIALQAISLVVAGSIVYMYTLITAPRRRIETFLRDVAAVEVGRTELANWLAQVERDGNTKFVPACEAQSCSVGMEVESNVLPALRIAPKMSAWVYVSFSAGVASLIHINLWSLRRDASGQWIDDKGVVVAQTVGRSLGCSQQYSVKINVPDKFRGGRWAAVDMDSCVSSEERSRAFAINTSCLTRIGACETPREMLPEVFGQQ